MAGRISVGGVVYRVGHRNMVFYVNPKLKIKLMKRKILNHRMSDKLLHESLYLPYKRVLYNGDFQTETSIFILHA